MKTLRSFSPQRFFMCLPALGLLAAACAPAATVAPATAPTSTTAPTVASTQILATALPTQSSTATTAPTQKPTTAPTVAATKAAPTATAVPTQKPLPTVVPLALGQAGTVGTLSLAPSAAARLTASGTDKPKANDVFVVVTLTVANTSKTAAVSFDSSKIMIMDTATGATVPALSLKSIKNAQLAQSLKAGAKVTGAIVFEEPSKDGKTLMLIFSDGQNQVRWKLS